MKSSQPAISVITVTFNAKDALEKTIASILLQDTDDFEYVVVDGGSTDGTLEAVNASVPLFTRRGVSLTVVSEQDNGIYDAMNKGLALASGEFINFLNAGDRYATPTVLNEVISLRSADYVCGAAATVDAAGDTLGVAIPNLESGRRSFLGDCGICHQAWFQRRALAPRFKTYRKMAADYRWIIECFDASKEGRLSRAIFIKYLYGGASRQRYLETFMDKVRIVYEVYGPVYAATRLLQMPWALIRACVLGPAKRRLLKMLKRFHG